jgi:hypothetical protein
MRVKITNVDTTRRLHEGDYKLLLDDYNFENIGNKQYFITIDHIDDLFKLIKDFQVLLGVELIFNYFEYSDVYEIIIYDDYLE